MAHCNKSVEIEDKQKKSKSTRGRKDTLPSIAMRLINDFLTETVGLRRQENIKVQKERTVNLEFLS